MRRLQHARAPIIIFLAFVVVVLLLAVTAPLSLSTSGSLPDPSIKPGISKNQLVIQKPGGVSKGLSPKIGATKLAVSNKQIYSTPGNSTSVWLPCTKLQFASPPFKKTALATFPGSGNTWTRHLIQQLTGYYTGSIYNDRKLKKGGLLGEHVQSGRVIAIKTHKKLYRDYYKAVIVIRAPDGTIMADYKRRKNGHTGKVNNRIFKTPAWHGSATRMIPQWVKWQKYWLNFPGKKLVVLYENMVEDLKPELQKFCEFLGVTKVCTERRIKCVMLNSTGNFKRKSSSALDFDPFTKEQHYLVDKAKNEVYTLLNKCIDRDRDNDANGGRDCGKEYNHRWWFNNCHYADATGVYLTPPDTKSFQGITWQAISDHSLKTISMKHIRK